MIDEAALRRQVSGRAVMRDQLRHLIAVCEMPRVTIQVLPFSAGRPPAAIGGLPAVLRLPDRELPDIGYLEQFADGRYFHTRGYVDYFRDVLNRLALQAESPEQSQNLAAAHRVSPLGPLTRENRAVYIYPAAIYDCL